MDDTIDKQPLIVDIKGNSLDDGPGIRSVFFFKGCPLSCIWCHNPECRNPRRELQFDQQKCIGCRRCIEACPERALSRENRFFVDRDRCNLCFTCTKVCPAAALTTLGRYWNPTASVVHVLRDKLFFDNSGGGVTLSGGEPTMHMGYVTDLLAALKEKGIHTLMETCGYFDWNEFTEKVIPFVDVIYMDLKLIDAVEHRRYCGTDNTIILENMVRLHQLSRSAKFKIVPRIPLVPGITATEENLDAAARFLQKHGFKRVELLPYNPLWGEKLFSLGLPNPYAADHPLMNWMDRDAVEKAEQLFRNYKIFDFDN